MRLKMDQKLKKNLRRITAAALSSALLITGALTAFAAEGDLIPLDLKMVIDTTTNASTEVEVFWSDAWFSEPSTEYNHELAITSIALSGTAYLEGPDEDHSDSSMLEALLGCGFDESSIIFYNYDYPYTVDDNDVVAYTFAAKQTEYGPLVAVIVRGTLESREWDSDLRVSLDQSDYENAVEHYGFYQAESKLAADLDEYLAALAGSNEVFEQEDLKFYLTGHSRGGSVADILAAALDDTYGKDKVYAYTFAAPAVAVRAGVEGYENIFNILSADDHVSTLPFSKLDFNRFGVDKVIAASGEYESENEDVFLAHDPFVYYARMKSALPDTLFE